MPTILFASSSIPFRSFLRDALTSMTGAVLSSAASSSIVREKLSQQASDVLIVDGASESHFGDLSSLIVETRKFHPRVRILVVGSDVERLNVDTIEAPTLEKPTQAEVVAFALRFTKWFARESPVPSSLCALRTSPNEATATSANETSQTRTLLAFDGAETAPQLHIDWPVQDLAFFKPKAIVIGSSTGGPAALERFFSVIRPPLPVPILICQHMPPNFTRILAAKIQELTGIPAIEGKQGDVVLPGNIYVAPGDFHMSVRLRETVGGETGEVTIVLDQRPLINSVRPAVDPLFESAADIYGRFLLAFVLTGMGEDGKRGAIAVRSARGVVAIQDAASSIVFGMPRAVYDAKACDAFGTPEDLGTLGMRLIGRLNT